jgi:lipid II:glycine glycyltransferase (peptidoglycan interpeptide bridge formation enzyme)
MMTYIFTKEKEWLEKWDNFVSNNPKGSHLILSDWLKSYKSYGFDFEIGLVLDNDQIVGGYGAIIPKFLFFKFYIIPHGPVYNDNHNRYLENHIFEIKRRAKSQGTCYLQLSMPISSDKKIAKYVYKEDVRKTLGTLLKSGKQFSYVYATYGINWVDLYRFKNSDLFLEQLTPKVRRNIRMPYNKGAKVNFVTDIAAIEIGYDVIIENAKQGNYSVRTFSGFKNTIFELVSKKQAYFIVCEVENEIKAAAFFVLNSNYITNITGGVIREKPDIKLGYMLQWEMIKKSFELGLEGYNISMGGSSGVQDFKTKFGAESISFEDPHYHIILKPLHYKIFKIFDTYLKPYKAQISKLLARLK